VSRLQSTAPRQLILPLGGPDPIQRVWESFPPEARERILRLLARAIGRILADGGER
jgi:hypothetical protein